MRVTPAEVMVAPGATMQFQAESVDGSGLTPDSWECTGGTIDANGLFTAGLVEGPFTVTAIKAGYQNGVQSALEVSSFNPVTDLAPESWCPVDDMGFSADQSIAQVDDISGNSRHMAQGVSDDRPIAKLGLLNGHDVAQYDGVTDNLNNAGFSTQSAWGARTTYLVVRSINSATHAQVVFMHSGGYFRLYSMKGQGGGLDGWTFTAHAGAPFVNVSSASSEEWGLLAIRVNSAASLDVALNDGSWVNVNPHDSVWDQAPVNQDVKVGKHIDSDAAACQSAGYFHIPSAVSDANHVKVRRWFNGKYRIFGGAT
jgi:hypothetical protein